MASTVSCMRGLFHVFAGITRSKILTYWCYIAVTYGLGRHVWVLPWSSFKPLMLSLFITGIFYPLTMTLVNISMLVLYWRTFGVVSSARTVLRCTGIFVLMWGLVAVSSTVWRPLKVTLLQIPSILINDDDRFWELFFNVYQLMSFGIGLTRFIRCTRKTTGVT